jgi:DNA topoisomerase-1
LHRYIKATEQAKQLGAMWKALGEEEKERFEGMARGAKQAAAAAVAEAAAEAAAGGGAAAGVAKAVNPTAVNPKAVNLKPKRAPSAYLLFCSEARGSLPPGLRQGLTLVHVRAQLEQL